MSCNQKKLKNAQQKVRNQNKVVVISNLFFTR